MKQKTFAYFFSEKDLENILDIEDFFISKNIYVPHVIKTQIDEEILCTNSYKFNPDLIDEIYNSFLIEKALYIDDFVEYKIDNIKMLIKLAHNQKREKEIIEKHLKKHAKKITKIDLAEDLFHLESHIDLISESSKNSIKNSISLEVDSEIVIDFLIHGHEMHYFEHDLFKEYYDIDFNQRVIKRLKEISKEPIFNQKTNFSENNKNSNYPLVFVNLDKELFFKSYLKTFDAIDRENKPVKGIFQPYCDAFYRAVKELEDDHNMGTPKIIQRGRNKIKFIAMINKEYNLTLSKLSNGLNYTDIAVEFIKNRLENKKEQK